MKSSRFSQEQIIGILKQGEAGVKVTDLCRQHGISGHTYYRWKSKFGGMEVSEAKRLKALEEENRQLTQLSYIYPAVRSISEASIVEVEAVDVNNRFHREKKLKPPEGGLAPCRRSVQG